MEKVFLTRPDWFEVKIVPTIRRRTILAAIIFAACIAGWIYFESWIPLAIGALVIGDRVFELARIPSTKKTICSLSVTVTEAGLSFQSPALKDKMFYPWASLTFKTMKSNYGVPELITIEDKNRKRSKVELTRYEEMSELIALIESNASKS